MCSRLVSILSQRPELIDLQPVDFTVLKAAGTLFFTELFRHVFFATQLVNPSVAPAKAVGATLDRQAIEQVFVKAAAVPNVAVGMAYFLDRRLLTTRGGGDPTDGLVASASRVALQVLRADMDMEALH
jgi:nucleolar MIF4G domain-containing protein 1